MTPSPTQRPFQQTLIAQCGYSDSSKLAQQVMKT